MANAQSPEDFRGVAEALRELGSEQQEKYDNMPGGLQQRDNGQMLEERASNCESWADEIEQRADELESALEAVDAAWQAWADWDLAEEEACANDEEGPDEPDEERPEGSTIEEARQAVIDEHRDVFDNNPF